MKTFKYKFTKLITALIYVGMALAVVAFGLTIYFVVVHDYAATLNPVYDIIGHTLMFLVSVAIFVILLSLLLSSYYAVDTEKKLFKTSFGIIKSKYDVNKIESVVLDRTTEKLSVFFDSGEFMTIVVKQEWYADFVEALLAANPKIEYSVKSKENTPDDRDGKKP